VFSAQAASHWLDASPPNIEEVRASLSRVVKNGSRADDVIRRLRALVKKKPARQEHLSINEAIHEVIALTRGEVTKHHVAVFANLERNLPTLEGDKVQLQQVIMNLMINAIEAMDYAPDGVRELTIATSSRGDSTVRVSVRDTGPGIGIADTERVFEPFYTTKASGMGMGLSICRSIIEAHGGTLLVFQNEPHGAVFQFELRTAAAST
jgi:C4-dicarboxylate-specific signal transduction histidine kinase